MTVEEQLRLLVAHYRNRVASESAGRELVQELDKLLEELERARLCAPEAA